LPVRQSTDTRCCCPTSPTPERERVPVGTDTLSGGSATRAPRLSTATRTTRTSGSLSLSSHPCSTLAGTRGAHLSPRSPSPGCLTASRLRCRVGTTNHTKGDHNGNPRHFHPQRVRQPAGHGQR